MALSYKDYIVETAPPSVYYIPNFISEDEEKEIVRNVYAVPKPKWTCLSNRRLQDYGGIVHKNGLIPESIPHWLQKYMKKINDLQPFEGNQANHVLINEYLPGQGIMAHTDGPAFYPTVTTINCSSHTVLEFREDGEDKCNLLLEPRSLLILQDDMYKTHLHSISEIKTDVLSINCVNLQNCLNRYQVGDSLQRDTRISVTIRNVPKVSKIKLW